MIAPQASAGFVANMDDVLEVYQRPHDPLRPVVCLDETSKSPESKADRRVRRRWRGGSRRRKPG